MNSKPAILYVDDEKPNLSSFKFCFRDNYDVHLASSAEEGLEVLNHHVIHVVISDQRMPGVSGVEFLEQVRKLHPRSFRMVLTGYSDMDAIVDAINKGNVYYYFSKPWDELEMGLVINNALEIIAIEQQLENSNETVKQLIEHTPDALVVMDVAGRINLFNKRAENLFGYLKNEIEGHLIETLIPHRYVNHNLKRHEYIRNPQVRTMGMVGELYAKTKDGHEFPAEISLSPLSISEGMMVAASVRDVSERKRAERILQDVEERRNLALEAASIGTWDWDMLLDHVTWDDRMIEIFDCDPVDHSNYGMFTSCMHPDDRDRVSREVEYAAQGSSVFRTDYRILCKDQSIRYINAMGRVHFNDEGAPVRMIGACIDISERKLAEKEIRELNENLEKRVEERTNELLTVNVVLQENERRAELLRESADNANRAKSDFLATMSHEIRTPMNGVIGMIDLLRQSKMSVDQTQMIDTIRDSSFSLLNIIDDILDFSKIEAGKLTLEQISVDLCSLIEGVVETLAPVARKKGIRLHSFIDPAIPEMVMCDQVRIRQILFNLGGNAIKFTSNRQGRKGEVVLRADLVELVSGEYAKIQFRIIDNGIGMTPEVIAGLFQPFSQADSATTRRYGGTGLGLSICSRLTDLMEGDISVSSQQNLGSEFRVTLRLPISSTVTDSISQFDMAGLRVLVISVEATMEQFLLDYLKYWGVEASCCRDHSQVTAIAEQAKRSGKPFDIVVLGNCWDKSTKTDLRREFRDQEELSDIRFIVLASMSDNLTELDCPDSVIIKGDPIRRQVFLRAMAIAVDKASPELPQADAVGILPIERLKSFNEAESTGSLVLVAEDNKVNQEVLLRQLNLLGYTAQVAADGCEALDMWKQRSYGLLMSDCHMPEMDGFELTQEIRALEVDSGQRAPIIAVTANALQGEAERCLEAGMDDYLPKPVELIELRRKLQKWLPIQD